jgi:AcrR family transcriptional regulator
MPARPKTSDAEIIRATRDLIERDGRNGLSMINVASAVGIRTPSLYSRFKDRKSLLGGVEVEVCNEVTAALAGATVEGDPAATLVAQAHAFRQYVKANPQTYALMYDVGTVPSDEAVKARVAATAAILPPMIALAGERQALLMARVLAPFLHGFVCMEITNAFRMGGDLDEAFEHGVRTIIAGIRNLAKA